MHPVMTRIAAIPGFRACAPWLGLLLLNALFIAPAVALQLGDRPWLLLQPSGDFLVLVLAYSAGHKLRGGRWIQRVATLCGVLLWLYHWDELIASAIVHQNPPLYDQLFLLRHLGVLVFDLWSWKVGLAILGVSAGLGLVVVLGRVLLRTVTLRLSALPKKVSVAVAAIGVMALVVTTVYDYMHYRRTADTSTIVGWTTPRLISNVRASVRMYRALEQGINSSTYVEYDSKYTLTRKPDIQLFLVESYGRILAADPEAGPLWREQMTRIEADLTERGWHVVSGYSRAPISGGRSWLAEATLLTGVFVQFEAVFRHLMDGLDETPHLVSFLDKQGYDTVLLAPKDRPRPGVEAVNHYAYDHQLLALDIDYSGPKIGWGIVPDQYTLGFAHENIFEKVEGPIFSNFHMVSSHAPWNVVPELVDDWRTLNGAEAPEESRPLNKVTPGQEFMARVRRYERTKPKYNYMGDADALKIEAYSKAIFYDLELLGSYVGDLEGDKIIIIMGDHQPPLLSPDDGSYDVPIHVLSRDSDVLQEFREHGFIDGFLINNGRPSAIGHEGMFSLMMRTLVRCCTDGSQALPPYVPEGVHPGQRPTPRGR